MITPHNLLRHEFTGLKVRASSKGKTIEGEIVGESAKTFTLKTPRGEKTLVKDSTTLEVQLPEDARVRVCAGLLKGRAYDRIKKKHRIRF